MTDRDEIIRAINTLTKAGYVVVPPEGSENHEVLAKDALWKLFEKAKPTSMKERPVRIVVALSINAEFANGVSMFRSTNPTAFGAGSPLEITFSGNTINPKTSG